MRIKFRRDIKDSKDKIIFCPTMPLFEFLQGDIDRLKRTRNKVLFCKHIQSAISFIYGLFCENHSLFSRKDWDSQRRFICNIISDVNNVISCDVMQDPALDSALKCEVCDAQKKLDSVIKYLDNTSSLCISASYCDVVHPETSIEYGRVKNFIKQIDPNNRIAPAKDGKRIPVCFSYLARTLRGRLDFPSNKEIIKYTDLFVAWLNEERNTHRDNSQINMDKRQEEEWKDGCKYCRDSW